MVFATSGIFILLFPAISFSVNLTWLEIFKLLDSDAPKVDYYQTKVNSDISWSDILKLFDGKDTDNSPLFSEICDTSCDPLKVTLTKGDANKKTTTPTISHLNFIANKCRLRTVTCHPDNGGSTFMQFNTNQGGPSVAVKSNVSVTLQCKQENGASVWTYKPVNSSESRTITEVNCVNS